MALTFTQSDLDALKEALLTGALEVRVGDRSIKYRSQAELMATIKLIETQMNGVPAQSPNLIVPKFSKGSG